MSHDLLLNTGNILSLSEIKLKAGRTSEEELIEALNIVLKNPGSQGNINIINGSEIINSGGGDRKELKITVKIFMPSADPDLLQDSINRTLETLQIESIETLILAYGEAKNDDTELESLKKLWPILEENEACGKLLSVGLSNVDTDIFVKLYEWAIIKPTIVQISLATCCVVPPALQTFTQQHDIQLLTHNDPYQVLSGKSLSELFGDEAVLKWVAKYQVHVKCRGVLSSKGYLVNLKKP
ncbi:hypothetical protein PV328_002150 [Microctonus aethiopoides]|uniref:GCS light chain n=1 Tax=Microctonus aethiopoides TaxID=144406 RepID=A0AA39FZ80_9HYME|nr:hypothetical protein PV328_002150 [Microctonus aethiopoides]